MPQGTVAPSAPPGFQATFVEKRAFILQPLSIQNRTCRHHLFTLVTICSVSLRSSACVALSATLCRRTTRQSPTGECPSEVIAASPVREAEPRLRVIARTASQSRSARLFTRGAKQSAYVSTRNPCLPLPASKAARTSAERAPNTWGDCFVVPPHNDIFVLGGG